MTTKSDCISRGRRSWTESGNSRNHKLLNSICMHEAPAMTKTILVTILLCSVLLAGCSFGPGSLQRDHPRYSQALREIQDEHRLMNLVRLRYMETPVFLQVTSINTTYNLGVNANASVGARTASGQQ